LSPEERLRADLVGQLVEHLVVEPPAGGLDYVTTLNLVEISGQD
jgi:hypothetical protein